MEHQMYHQSYHEDCKQCQREEFYTITQRSISEEEFALQEHKGGQHQTYQEKCYECWKENKAVNYSKLMSKLI